MEFHPVTAADKPLIECFTAHQRFDDCGPTFANMLLWQSCWHISLCCEDDILYVFLHHRGHSAFMGQPIPLDFADSAKAAARALEEARRRELAPALRGCNAAFCQALAAQGGGYTQTPYRNAFEYIYSVPELIELPGRKFHSKRNHIAQFSSRYAPVWRPLTAADAQAVLAFFDTWGAMRQPSESLTDEREALKTAMTHWDLLGLQGAVIELEGRIAAFTVSGMLHSELAVIHFEKANTQYEGIYAYLNQGYLQRFLSHVLEVNRQEDIGLPGLRQAKLSYHPIRFAEKWIVTPT